VRPADTLHSGTLGARAGAAVLYALFFLSGFAALLYQVVWQRMLAIHSGVDVYSVTIIVAAFMAGLGIGNLMGGHVADRVGDRPRLLLFAGSEVCIALFALASKWLYYDVLYRGLGPLAAHPAGLALVLFLSLLWPTFFMGVSLPLLAKSLTADVRAAPGTVGGLYGLNTLGAGIGAVLAAWTLIPAWGFLPTIHLGAALNTACAVGALAVIPRLAGAAPRDAARAGAGQPDAPVREPAPPATPAAPATGPAPPAAAAPAGTGLPVRAWIGVYALSGFIALSLEIVWFRLLGVIIKPSAFTFPTLLGVYVIGVALGTFLGIAWAARSRTPARSFLLLQAAIPVHAGLSLALLVLAIEGAPWMEGLREHLAGYEAINLEVALQLLTGGLAAQDLAPPLRTAGSRFVLLYLTLPALLVLPATLMMGMSFPLLQKVVQRDRRLLGRRVGWLQTANIAGSMAGAMLTGWLLLGVLGTAGTLRALLALGAVFLLLLLRVPRAPGRRTGLAPAACLALWGVTLWLAPGPTRLWAVLHGAAPADLIHAEDETGLSAIKPVESGARGARRIVYVNGLGQSWIPYGGVHTLLGALPALLHPAPRDVAIIGLGSGDTLYAAGGREETRSLTCFELIATQLETLERTQQRTPDGGLGSILGDERLRLVVADGRAALAREGRRYDVIEADALRPNSAYAGNLYSVEYFELLREHLAPGGLAVTWSATPRVLATFVRVFPHVLHLDPILVGSDRPIESQLARLRDRAREPATRAYYARAGIDVVAMVEQLLSSRRRSYGPQFDRSRIVDVNTDLYPRDEYLLPAPPDPLSLGDGGAAGVPSR
jgi:spermidine synthase